MSNTYRINFKELRQENCKDIFAAFERALQQLDIDFYLIGALARDTWFAQKGIRALGTTDIDLAVLISDAGKFVALKDYLISQEGFVGSSSNEYTLFGPTGFQLDLLPFGFVEIEGKKIFDKEGLVHTDISGFREVFEAATEEVNFDGKYRFNVATLAGIVILKLISYDDRPEIRSDDVKDIGAILKNYFELQTKEIYDHHVDLFQNESNDLAMIGARVLGRQMQPILGKNELLKERVLTILRQNTSDIHASLIGFLLQDESPSDTEYQIAILRQVIEGILEVVPGSDGKK